MPVTFHPPGTPLPANSPFKGSTVHLSIKPPHYLRELAKMQTEAAQKQQAQEVGNVPVNESLPIVNPERQP